MQNPIVSVDVSTAFYQTDSPLYDVCEVNGSLFALFHQSISTKEQICLDFEDHNVVFISPLLAGKEVFIKAVNVIALTDFTSMYDGINICASGRVILLGAKIQAFGKNIVNGDLGVHMPSLPVERRKDLIQLFAKAFNEQDGDLVVDALIETFDLVTDPFGEKSSEDILVADVFDYLNISY